MQRVILLVCDGDEAKARQIGGIDELEREFLKRLESSKSKQEPQREPRQIQVKAKSKDFER